MSIAPAASGTVARQRAVAASLWLSDRFVLAAMVAASTVFRFWLALSHVTPRYFPDEYIYPEVANSILRGRLEIRGEPAAFPALLESIVTAPLWLAEGVELPFRLVQLQHALVVSLLPIPVYWIARHLGFDRRERLACAVVALVFPALVYAEYLTADALGLTLAVSALALALRTTHSPTRWNEAAFLIVAGLAMFARVQYVVLFAAFAAAALVRQGGRPWRTVGTYPVLSGALVAAVVSGLALGSSRLLGYYEGLLDLDLPARTMLGWAVTDVFLLCLASGVVLAPFAAVGLAASVARPRAAPERSFAVLVGTFMALVVFEAALYASNGSARFQERYFLALLPLFPVLAVLGLRRVETKASRIGVAGVSVALVLALMRRPLTDYIQIGPDQSAGDQDSPSLSALTWLAMRVGNGNSALVAAGASTVLCLVALFAAYRGRARFGVIYGVVTAALLATTFAAQAVDTDRSNTARRLALAQDARWIDNAGLGGGSVLVTRDAIRWIISQQLFWNRSLERVLTLQGAPEADAFQNADVRIDATGTLRENGIAVEGPVLVTEYAATAMLDDARLVTRQAATSLWQPRTEARLSWLVDGRYFDGYLAFPDARIRVWPGQDGHRAGVVCLRFDIPGDDALTRLDLSAPGYRRSLLLRPGVERAVAVPFSTSRAWTLSLKGSRPFVIGPRLVAARLIHPHVVEGPIGPQGASAPCR